MLSIYFYCLVAQMYPLGVCHFFSKCGDTIKSNICKEDQRSTSRSIKKCLIFCDTTDKTCTVPEKIARGPYGKKGDQLAVSALNSPLHLLNKFSNGNSRNKDHDDDNDNECNQNQVDPTHPV